MPALEEAGLELQSLELERNGSSTPFLASPPEAKLTENELDQTVRANKLFLSRARWGS